MKNPSEMLSKGFYRDSYRIQTCNLLIRSQMLYSVELRSRFRTRTSVDVLAKLLSDDSLLLDSSLLTGEISDVEDTCSANLTVLVNLD